MKFDLELFKQSIESDTKELVEFNLFVDESLYSIDDNYLDSLESKLEAFILEGCNGVNNGQNVQVFVKTVLVKYAYLQGLKEGKEQVFLDVEKFEESRNSYKEKKKHSKFSGTILNGAEEL